MPALELAIDPIKKSLRAGVARNEITRREEDVAVNDPLFVKALVMSDGACTIVLLALDAVAIGGIADIRDDFLPRLRKSIDEALGIPPGHVLVNASHTHPGNHILCGDAELLHRTLDAVQRAHRDMVPVKVGGGRGREDRIIINRILRLKNGEGWTIRHSYPSPPDDEVTSVGPIDPDIGLLRVDRLAGGTLAVVYNYACHTLIGVPSGAITANFPGFASEVIEDHLDGAMAIFLQGAAGDITELHYKDVHQPMDARPLGTMLGLSVLKALKNIETSVEAGLQIRHEPLELPRRTDSEDRIAELEEKQSELLSSLRFTSLNFKTFLPLSIKYLTDPAHPSEPSYRYLQDKSLGRDDLVQMDKRNRNHLEKYAHNIRVMEELSKIVDDIATLKKHQAENQAAGGHPIPTEVSALKIGDFVLLTSATEVTTEVALNIKNRSPHPLTFIAAFTNGYLHYGCTADAYLRGSYEVNECLLAPEWQQVYEEKAAKLLSFLKTQPARTADPAEKI